MQMESAKCSHDLTLEKGDGDCAQVLALSAEATMLVAVETEAAQGGLERGWKGGLGSAWQDFVCSEEKELPEWLRVEFEQKHNSWGTAERQQGAELCSRNESLTFGLQGEESLIHSATLCWVTAQDSKPLPGERKVLFHVPVKPALIS